MNEQQRTFFTVLLCASIWLGWQVLFGEPPQETPAKIAEVQVDEPHKRGDASERPQGVAPAPPQAAAPLRDAPPAFAKKSRDFRTERMVGTVENGNVHFADLMLPAFAAFDHQVQSERIVPRVHGEQLVADAIRQQGILQVLVNGQAVPLDFEPAGEGQTELALRGGTADGVRVALALSPLPDRYAVACRLDIDNQSGAAITAELDVLFALPHAEPAGAREKGKSFLSSFAGQAPSLVQGLYIDGDKIQRKKKLTDAAPESRTLRAAGLELPYFVLAWLPDADESLSATFVPLEENGHQLGLVQTPNGVLMRATQALGLVQPGAHRQSGAQMYLGPKRDAELIEVDSRLDGIIDYDMLGVPLGFLARPMMFFMRIFYQWTHSWGVAIIMLTFFVKLLLLPPNLKSGASIRRMQALKPEVEALQKRHKNDPAKLQSEQIALYRKHNINPASGCLPVLLQIPVWLTLYRSLASAVDLYRQPFLWLTDLTATEPIPVLALTAGALTIVQQRLTPMATDSQQARVMMWVLPALVTVFMINMPAGLVLYILVNSILTLLQQVVINRRAV